MELSERCLHLCSHITTLTGVHSTLLHIPSREFLIPPFQTGCKHEATVCSAALTHLYGAYEAQRWDGKYIYYCPRGLVFLAASLRDSSNVTEYCVITGPMILTNSDEDPFEDPFEDPLGDENALSSVPRMSTARARALSELIAAAAASLTQELLPPDVDSGSLADMLQMMYDYTEDGRHKGYPIESEHLLQAHIRSGDKESAQKLLNELLVHIYHQAGSNTHHIKARIRELLVLMNRAAIDGGADPDEIFTLYCRYEREVDSFRSIEELNRWIGTILHQFISFVFDFNTIKHQNAIFKTTAFIKEHLTEKLSLDQAAEQVIFPNPTFAVSLRTSWAAPSPSMSTICASNGANPSCAAPVCPSPKSPVLSASTTRAISPVSLKSKPAWPPANTVNENNRERL